MKNELLNYYLEKLDYQNIPKFLEDYLEVPSMKRLKKIGYFCGMDYASKDIYNFKEYITRYDHSLTVSLLTYKLTKDKNMTLAGLFHDVGTPCFSHVIDYMNEDYVKQESTEKYTEDIMKKDNKLTKLLIKDNIGIESISDFKKYSVVDNKRPKLCADRLDGIILTGIGWTRNIDKKDIDDIVENIKLFNNENNELEIGFTKKETVNKVLDVNNEIDICCHSKEDNYMMMLLSKITKLSILKGYITYQDLYTKSEKEMFDIFYNSNDKEILNYLQIFKTIKQNEINNIEIPKSKIREIRPLLNGKRI